MAVNNANLHKLPLKSTLNMNRFENEINDWKQYINLNSPVYGGVLSNFYKKNIQLAEGHEFITYDKKNRIWTKKYNAETTNTDVYCGDKFITSFNNKTAEFQELEKDSGIIGGTRDYPIYTTDYPGYEISTKYLEETIEPTGGQTSNVKLLVVLYYEKNNYRNQNIDIYECNNGSKTLKNTISVTLPQTSVLANFFINGFINVNGFLFLTILPNGNYEFDDLFNSYKIIAINLLSQSYNEIGFKQYDNPDSAKMLYPKKCDKAFAQYPFTNDVVYPTGPSTATPFGYGFVKDDVIYSENVVPNLPQISKADFKSDYKNTISSKLCSSQTEFIFVDNETSAIPYGLISNDKLLIFATSSEDNNYGIKYGLGEFATIIDKNTGLELTVNSNNEPVIEFAKFGTDIPVYSIKSELSRFYFVGNLDNAELPPILTEFIGTDLVDTNFYHVVNENFNFTNALTFNGNNEVVNKIRELVWNFNIGGVYREVYFESNQMLGFIWNEISKLNIKFNLSPFNVNIICGNEYTPTFHGFYYTNRVEYDTPLSIDVYEDSPELIIGSDYTGNIGRLSLIITGNNNSSLQISHANPVNDLDYHDEVYIKCSENTSSNLIKMDKVTKCCDINLLFPIPLNETDNEIYFSCVYGILWNVYDVHYKDITRSSVKEVENYKLNFGKLGVTYTLGEPFAITRGIMNLFNQILRFNSVEILEDETYIYFTNNQGYYCCIKSVDKTDVLDSIVVDDFIIFKTSDYGNNNFNAIDMENFEFFPTSLDWNSRNSLFFTDDCGINFEDDNICYLFNEDMSERKLDEPGVEQTQDLVFISSINERFLAASTRHGIGANWCSSLVGTQYLYSISSKFVTEETLTANGFLGTDFYFSMDDYISDYEKFFINVYTNNLGETPTSVAGIFYRFSIPNNNPDMYGLENLEVSFPFEGNVLYNISLFDEIFTTKYFPEWFVKIGEDVYNMMKNGSTLQPVFSYELLTGVTVDGIFVINGSIYGYTRDYIVPLSYSDGVVTRGEPILNKEELFYIESTPYLAYFYSYQNRSVYAFSGDNTMAKLFESNRIETIDKAYYNTATQDIWCSTNDGTLIIHSDNTFIKLNDLRFENIGILKEVLYVLTQNDELIHISYNFDEEFEKLPINLETEFFGVDDFTTSVNDCVYIRLVTDEGHNDWIGDVELMCKTLTQISKFSETKKFHIEKSTWDKETKTILLRYQPKYQEGIGFGIKLKSDFPISGIYINSTPVAIANSKHNV